MPTVFDELEKERLMRRRGRRKELRVVIGCVIVVVGVLVVAGVFLLN